MQLHIGRCISLSADALRMVQAGLLPSFSQSPDSEASRSTHVSCLAWGERKIICASKTRQRLHSRAAKAACGSETRATEKCKLLCCTLLLHHSEHWAWNIPKGDLPVIIGVAADGAVIEHPQPPHAAAEVEFGE